MLKMNTKGQGGFKWWIAALILAIAFLVIYLIFIGDIGTVLKSSAKHIGGGLAGY